MKKLKPIAGCMIVVVLTLFGLMWFGKLLAPGETQESINSINAFHSQERNSLDVIVFGTSHAWKGFDSNTLNEEYGLKTYNYAGNWQGFNTTLMFLQDAFRTQKPKAVLIDTYTVDSLIKDINMEGQIYYSRAVSDFQGKRRFLKDCFGNRMDRYLSYYLPIIMFHDNWINLERSSFVTDRTKTFYLETMGYDSSSSVVPVSIDLSLLDEQTEISDDSLAILDEMVELCTENDCVLLFYTCPYYGLCDKTEAMNDYANSHTCYYYNLFEKMDEIGLNGETDFRDSQHLNDSGSRKVASYLGNIIQSILNDE